MVVEDCTMAESKLAQATPADFLVCGACHKNFMLSSMQDFVQHKLFDCEDISGKAMECQSCRKRFQTPWSLLQHAQKNHALNIFLEHGPYSSEIQGLTMEEATSTRTTIAKVSVGTNTEEDIFKHTAPSFADLSTQSNLVHSSPSGHIVNDTAVDLAPAHITTHSVVTRSSNVATAAVSQCSMPSPTKSTSSVSVSPTSVAIVLPKLVQVSDKIRPLLSGSHAISVLQPIRLPQGTLIGAPIDSSMSRMTLSTLPVVEPLTQAKSPTVPVQTIRVSTPNITLTTANAKSPEQSKPISFTPNTNSSPRLILPQTAGQSSYIINMEDSSTHSPRDEVQAGPTSKILESPLPLSQIPNGSQVPHVRPVLDMGRVPVVGQSPNVDHVGQLSSVSGVVQGPAIVPEPNVTRKAIICPVVSVSQTLDVNKVITVTQGESAARLSEPVQQNVPTAVAKSGLASLLTCVCPCCKVGKCCVRNLQLSGVGACGPPGPVVAETAPHKAPPTGDVSAASALVILNDAAVPADNSKCCCKPTTKSLKRKRDVEIKDQEEEENEKDEEEEVSDKDAENTIQCCDNQDCGVTIMPGTHEGLKKCCNAVVPKKRKRHMETKHRVKKRAAAEASFAHPEENTIYIDYFQPSLSAARPRVSTSVAGVTLGSAGSDSCGTITVNTSSSVGTQQVNSAGRDNPSSLTLSIPVSYTRKTSCSSGSCSKQSSGDKQDCGCGCCPLLGYSNREKKLSKSGRRLSSGNGDSRREPLTNSDSKSAGQNNELKVKLESSNAAESGGEQGADHGDRIGLRKTVRTGMSNKKRRYPTSRPFKCDQCDNAFNQRIHLKKHQSKHTGIKPFKCEQCDYSTVERSHLKVHIRVHTGEKPFKCSHCEYATAQNSTLKIHLKRHHGQGGGEDGSPAPFSCTVCGLEFDDEGPYLQHLQDQPSHASSEPHASSSGSKSDSGTGQPSGEGTSREEGTLEEQDPEEKDPEEEGAKGPVDRVR